MSELKVYQVICTDDIDRNEITENFSAPDFLAYDADEADKVISDLKARVAQLEDDNALLRKNNAELRSKNEGLLYALADAETDLAMSQRWRKYSEEKPEDEERVLVVQNGEVRIVQYSRIDGVFHTLNFKLPKHSIDWWMPLPKAPEDK